MTEANRTVQVNLLNVGSPIATALLGRIFEHGVSDQATAGAEGCRGQGLFVARAYMVKMGGTIVTENATDGVVFTMTLQHAAAA